MSDGVPRNGMRLIKSPGQLLTHQEITPTIGHQTPLFPSFQQELLVFVGFPKASEQDFLGAIENVRPRLILDLRRFPRFDYGKLNRKKAFAIFQNYPAKYIDVRFSPGSGDSSKRLDSIIESSTKVGGPIMFLLDPNLGASFSKSLASRFVEVSKRKWDVLEVPSVGRLSQV